ncbi:MAG: rRNA pseudouridine synthase [candidate division NC10 bacterium]|nr:rRNA pseudouridine synthase [candidate division NC10 bacterium]
MTGSEERLQKILARAGFGSRRACEGLIREGRVAVNGVVVQRLGTRADPAADTIEVDSRPLPRAATPVYVLLHKPPGVITSLRDPQGRPVVTDLLPRRLPRVFPVGRLDFASEGLLLLTNDGALMQRMLHPAFAVPRTYHARVRGVLSPTTLAAMCRGVRVQGERLRALAARPLKATDRNAWVEVVVAEGKHHEVRRLCQALGHPVLRLRRVAFGPLRLGRLRRGEWRPLSEREMAALRALGRTRPLKAPGA